MRHRATQGASEWQRARRALRALVLLGALAGGAQAEEGAAQLALAGAQEPSQAAVPRLSLTLTSPLPSSIGNRPGQDLGLQWRQPIGQERTVDITAWRRIEQPDAMTLIGQRQDTLYGARLEMRIRPARSGLVADYRFLGVQLDSGARIGIRRKDGNPALYYRSQF